MGVSNKNLRLRFSDSSFSISGSSPRTKYWLHSHHSLIINGVDRTTQITALSHLPGDIFLFSFKIIAVANIYIEGINVVWLPAN